MCYLSGRRDQKQKQEKKKEKKKQKKESSQAAPHMKHARRDELRPCVRYLFLCASFIIVMSNVERDIVSTSHSSRSTHDLT